MVTIDFTKHMALKGSLVFSSLCSGLSSLLYRLFAIDSSKMKIGH